ncbi:S41 family peptidase [Brumimicrobium aurantiacum]|uniref:S41 family peptidase n=1 Tax=Brumimicrobium aurantiacum TaxID=1737063 RepID=A0A3E1EXD5_9FLAO|nr:S41 family peptidase [Brumimicrobium aurantiacum]RFC54215.1 S41 family peptidase [Brumimicrobium aurantiacum]
MRNIYAIAIFILFGVNFNSHSQSNGFEVIKNLELIDLIYMNLDKYYVDEPKTGEISKAAIDAMLHELDPYTVYYHESNIEDYRLMTTGQYGGIGALIRKTGDHVIIAEPYENMPAQKAGLKAGDKIISIDGKSMKNVDSEVVSNALKGAKGSTFMLEFERPNQGVRTIEVSRDEIKVPDVPYSGMVDEKGKVGYIKLSSFTQTASRNVKSAFEDLSKDGMEKLILDLRGNGGGLLMESINIVNFFVPQNEEIVKTKGRILDENRTYKTQNAPLDIDIPVVVLVDEFSASASEIVSGSLQDLDRGVIIGNTTFGKGLVQRTIDLKYGAKMKLTIAKYYTPSGRCVQKLDYYHKNDGKVDEVPDSLIKIFHTKNGREVIDGRGIEPDIKIEEENLSRFTAVLTAENIIFDFATQFAQQNEEIASAEEFFVGDKIYKEFKNYVLKQDFEYKTATQERLENVLEVAKREGYEEKIDGEFEALEKVVKASKKDDLDLFEDQIKEILANEIVSRYYYQEGRVLNAFNDDKPLKKAIEILNNESEYKAILTP